MRVTRVAPGHARPGGCRRIRVQPQLTNLALLSTALALSADSRLGTLALALPLPGQRDSLIQRLRRMLENPPRWERVYRPLVIQLFANRTAAEIPLVMDRTDLGDRASILSLALAYGRRALSRCMHRLMPVRDSGDVDHRFRATLRAELLKRENLYTLKEARVLIEMWPEHDNGVRPHSSLGSRPPAPEAIPGTGAHGSGLTSGVVPPRGQATKLGTLPELLKPTRLLCHRPGVLARHAELPDSASEYISYLGGCKACG